MYKKIQLISLFLLIVFMFPTFVHAASLTYNEIKASTNYVLNRMYKTVYVTIPNGKNPTDIIQSELNKIKESKVPTKVVLPKGTFKLSSALTVYGNTWLSVPKETTLIRTFSGVMLKNGDTKQMYDGYNGESNIIIDGGTWDINADESKGGGGFALGHGQNILIQNLTIKDVYNGHGIDLGGDKNVLIRNNKFLGYKDTTTDKSRYFSEAIQLDGLYEQGVFGKYIMGAIDGTVSSNIIVENNYFGNSTTKGMQPWATGVGSHSGKKGNMYQNIFIKNNTFHKMTYAGVRMSNWNAVEITGNTFNETRGVLINSSYYVFEEIGKRIVQKMPNSNISISQNIFRNPSTFAVEIIGHENQKVTNVQIKNNQITNMKKGLQKKYAENVTMDSYYVKTGGIIGIEQVKAAQKDFAVPSTYTKTGNRQQFYQVVTGSIYSKERANAYSKLFTNKYGWNNKVVPTEKSGFYKIIITGFWSKESANLTVVKLVKDVGFWSYSEKGEIKDEYFITFGALSTQKEANDIVNKLKQNRKWWSYSYKQIVR